MGISKNAKRTTHQWFRKGKITWKQKNATVDIQETDYLSIMSHHPDTFYAMDVKGNILSCNNNVEGILGYTSSEIHGPFHRVVKKEDLKKVVKHFEIAVAGKVQNYSCLAVHKDGHFVDLHVTNIPMFSNGEIVGVYGIAKDITEIKLTEARLKENEIQFKQLFDSLDVGVWSWDIRLGKTQYVSAAVEALSGVASAEFKEGLRNWKEFIHPEDMGEFEKNQKELRNGIPCQYQYRIIDCNKEVKWIDARTFPVLDSDGILVRLDGLITDISKKKLEEQKINYFAYHDYLTGLPNRRKFEEKLENMISDKKSGLEKFSLLYIDLDRFKYVNDTLGHSVGDELLKEVSKRLDRHISSDDHLARLGGDEFAIILNDITDPNDSIKIASNIINDIEKQFKIDDYNLHITTSIGIATFPQDGGSVNELSSNADVALYRAKGIGKNNLQLYSPSMNIESYKQFVLENDLHAAVQEEQFILHYQPKVDPKTRVIVGAEALIRWDHPEWGILSPIDFIPLAEETNMIFEVGDWVIAEVCRQINRWGEEGKRIIPVSINISAKRFLKDDLVTKVKKILRETNVDPKWIEFEITETSIIQNEEKSLAAISLLKELGITISLDDFCTGYSSISYLKKFKADYLKIDRSFINGISSCEDDQAIVKSILFLARNLNMKVVAEGVETEEQLEFLLKHRCDLIQGFLFSKPVEAYNLENLISSGILHVIREENKKLLQRSGNVRTDLPVPINSFMTISEINGVSILYGEAPGLIENIGMGGLRFLTTLPLPVSKKLKLTIKTDIILYPLIVAGRIIWKEEVEDNKYQYRFEFDLTEKEMEWLSMELTHMKSKIG